MGSTCNQKNFGKLLGHHSNNLKVQQQNMVMPVINPTSPNITKVILVINSTSPLIFFMEFKATTTTFKKFPNNNLIE
jgi:hypothetical protein